MKIKILHILDSLNFGGPENGVVNLVNCLDHNKFSHTICVLRKIGPIAERFQRRDIEIICMDKSSRDYSMPFKLQRIIKRIYPDIIHTRNWGTIDGIIAAKLSGIKYAIHGEHGREFTDLDGSNYRRNLARWVLGRWVNLFVAVSDEIKSWLVNKVGIREKKVVTIINGVNTKIFAPAIDKIKARQNLGINPETFVIGTVGRLDEVKNYHMLLKGMLLLKESNVPWKLLFVGDGSERTNLEKFTQINEIPNVQFLGQKQNVQDYLKTFDLFVSTSLIEGICNTILEAMATGIPVVATRVGGTPEIVEDDVTGSLIPSGDYALLSEMITKYMNDRSLCEKHGQVGRLRCEKLFSLNIMVEKYDRLYSNLL